MKLELLNRLCCPKCRGGLTSKSNEADGTFEIETGSLSCNTCNLSFPIENSIPRFVPAENYAANFGMQWNLFRKTQLDSFSKQTISHDRFFGYTGWSKEELRGKWVLDVGCGAGRFSEIALACGANVVSIDYSSAVNACWENNKENECIHVVQGDIYSLPFPVGSFDFVYCLGVLQHTPDVRRSFFELPKMLRDGGKLCVDVYPFGWQVFFMAKHWLRPITTRLCQKRLFSIVCRWAPRLLPLSRFVSKIPFIGRKLRWVIPVANYEGVYPLSQGQLVEWAILDTFDWLAPAHDHPQSFDTLVEWFDESQLIDVDVFRHGHLVGRGRKPHS